MLGKKPKPIPGLVGAGPIRVQPINTKKTVQNKDKVIPNKNSKQPKIQIQDTDTPKNLISRNSTASAMTDAKVDFLSLNMENIVEHEEPQKTQRSDNKSNKSL